MIALIWFIQGCGCTGIVGEVICWQSIWDMNMKEMKEKEIKI